MGADPGRETPAGTVKKGTIRRCGVPFFLCKVQERSDCVEAGCSSRCSARAIKTKPTLTTANNKMRATMLNSTTFTVPFHLQNEFVTSIDEF
jgi:hypothetical protein